MGKIAEIYNAKVAAGEFFSDSQQLALLAGLEHLRCWLEQPPAPVNLFNTLFSKPSQPPKGLYIWGDVGRGKSMLMDLFFSATRIPHKRRVHFHAFMQEVQAGLENARHTHCDDPVATVATKIAAEARLLCFDEMQIHDIADAMIVGRLFQALLNAGTLIVTTSNRRPDDLYKDGLNRALFLPFIALIKNRLDVRHLISPQDYRQTQLPGEQVYFTPLTAQAHAAIERIWHGLTHGAAQPLELPVGGRRIRLPGYRNGVARATFWDLCGAALGPADYLAVAGAVRVLIIDDIPLLSRDNFNEARRFVTLIDALYEARVRLIASAADVPERLYTEGEGAFDFARTASRLREMQSAHWGIA